MIRLPLARRIGVVAGGLLLGLACAAESVSVQRTREIIDDLVAQQFGAASSRYRMYESEVLSIDAAPVWRRALGHADATVREWAVDALSRIGDAEDVGRIAGLLDDTSRGVRQQALDALIRIDPSVATESFRARLQGSSPEQVALAAQGLAQLGVRDTALAILERVGDTTLPVSTRGALMQPLAALGDPAVVAELVDLALDGEVEVSLRRLAAEAAVAIDSPDPRPALRRLAGADDDYVRALGERGLELQ